MKTDTPRPILLKDYRPPNYLIYAVNLDVSLHPTRTRVRARLKIRRNPAYPGNPGPLRLDGEMIELEAVRLDGRQLGPARIRAHRHGARHRRPAQGSLHARDHHLLQSGGQQGADGALPVARHLLHAVRGPGLPPHHLLPRPPGRARHLHRAHRGRPQRGPGAALQRQSRWSAARSTAASATTPCGTTPTPSPATCSRSSAAISPPIASDFTTTSGRKVDLRIYVEPGKEDRCAWAMDSLKRSHALGRGALRARVRPRRVQHRRRVRLQHGGDGEQGPQRLQRRADPGLARDRHRRHLRGHRARRSRTSTSTTGPATASPAATGSSSASRKASPSSATRSSAPTSARPPCSASATCAT